ncbi:PAB-dependent poly(A)-specific ribonuclease subunit 3 [Saitoella coloradoensis]
MFQPASPLKSTASLARDAPVFVPKTQQSSMAALAPEFKPGQGFIGGADSPTSFAASSVPAPEFAQQMSQMSMDPSQVYSAPPDIMNPYANPSASMYYQPSMQPYQPLQYHLYAAQPPHRSDLLPYQRTIHGFFLSDNIREELQRKSAATLQTIGDLNLPSSVHVYHSLVPLDTKREKDTRVFGYPSWVYKAFSGTEGKTYALRRIEGFRLVKEQAIGLIEQWRRVTNASIVTVHEAFTTKAFGDNSIVFAYDFHPLSTTLYDTHFGPNPRYVAKYEGQAAVPEKVIWSYITQITSALRAIHSAGLAARCIDPTKILMTSKMRIRLNCLGIVDVLAYDTGGTLEEWQQDDLLQLGRLIVSIACGSPLAANDFPSAVDFISRHYSAELKDIIVYLISKPSPTKTISEIVTLIADHTIQDFNSALHFNDNIEAALARELENGRIARLLTKLGFINERPEYDHDPQWSETGDRYLIKLFRDYVFHQVDEQGNPVVDMAHVLSCLNKLDVGSDEKVMLVSRDEQSCLVLSYREIKSCIEVAFSQLSKKR